MTKVGIIGGSGFAGEELIKLLSLHDSSSIIAISSRELKNTPVSDLFQGTDLNFVDPEDQIFFQCDVVFFATPHGTAMDKANSFIQKGIKVIDLSADFRLKDPLIWREWYGSNHRDLENLKNSIYGLTELNAELIETSNLVAVPGCYPTASILGLLPLVKNKLPIDSIIIDAKSGISGAGIDADLGAGADVAPEGEEGMVTGDGEGVDSVTTADPAGASSTGAETPEA